MVFVPSIDKSVGRQQRKDGGLVPLELPKIPVHLNVRQYLLSKVETNKPKNQPEWDIPRGTPATELVRSRRELHEADTRLQDKRKEYIQRRIILDAEWEELCAKEEELRKSFYKFNIFTKENEEKRQRAERKIKDEESIHVQRDETIAKMEHKVAAMIELKENMEKNVNEYRFYEEFLLSVVAVSEFKEVSSLLNRYETLADARSTLAKRQALDLERLENTRAKMMRLIEHKTSAVVGFNTKIAELENRYEKARENSFRWDTAIARVKSLSEKKKLDIRLVEGGIWNMYNSICNRKGKEPQIKEPNTEAQLMFIKTYLLDLRKIIKTAKKRAARDLESTQPVSHPPQIEVVKLTK